jgi:hypothetical protein
VAAFDANVPSIARVYDYVLGGKDNFAADRVLAERLVDLVPTIPVLARENRQFLSRAVNWTAGQGIGQFVDLGCGMPTAPNTHESARAVNPDAKVTYVDNDPIVVSHLNALVAKGNPGVFVVGGDVRDIAATVDGIRAHMDLSAPVCLVIGYLLHFLTADAARDLVAGYMAALAPGSYLVLSVLHAGSQEADEGIGAYSSQAAPVYSHPIPVVESFVGSLDRVPPGLIDARLWPTSPEDAVHLPSPGSRVIACVARKRP